MATTWKVEADEVVGHPQQQQSCGSCSRTDTTESGVSDLTPSITGLPVNINVCRPASQQTGASTRSWQSIFIDPWPTWVSQMLAEFVGTFFLTFLGTASVSAAVLTEAQAGLWQVAVVWGFAVTISILVTAHISGAHLNPAISFAFTLLDHKDFPTRKFLRYVVAQFLGAFVAGLLTYGFFEEMLDSFEARNGLIRGDPGSEFSAMTLCQYYPNPALANGGTVASVSTGKAFAVEAVGTGLLALVIFSMRDSCNNALGNKEMAPFFIGFTVAILISILAPFTQAGFNPARDFGPRLVALIFGWEKVAIPGPNNGFWVYIIAPMVGAPIGGAIVRFVLKRKCKPNEKCQ